MLDPSCRYLHERKREQHEQENRSWSNDPEFAEWDHDCRYRQALNSIQQHEEQPTPRTSSKRNYLFEHAHVEHTKRMRPSLTSTPWAATHFQGAPFGLAMRSEFRLPLGQA